MALKSPVENLYWFAGVVTYQLSLILVINASLLLIKSIQNNLSLKSFTNILANIFAFLTVGTNETLGFILLSVFAIFIFVSLHKKHVSKQLILFTFTAFIGFLIVYIAPGNSVRTAAFNNPLAHNIFLAIKNSLVDFVMYMVLIFSSLQTYILVVATVPPERAIGLITFLFYLSLQVLVIHICSKIDFNITNIEYQRMNYAISVSLVFVILAFITNFVSVPNSRLLMKNIIKGELYNYQNNYKIQSKKIQECIDYKTKNCIVPKLMNSSEKNILFFADIDSNSNHWINKDIASYYGLESIATE